MQDENNYFHWGTLNPPVYEFKELTPEECAELSMDQLVDYLQHRAVHMESLRKDELYSKDFFSDMQKNYVNDRLTSLATQLGVACGEYEGAHLTKADVQQIIDSYLDELPKLKNIAVSDTHAGIVRSFTVKSTRRHCAVIGFDENNVKLTEEKLRGRRRAKKVGRALLGKQIFTFTVQPIAPARTIKIEGILT